MTTTAAEIPPGSKPYRPRGAAEQLFYARDRRVLIEGPTRTGKSRGVLEKDFYCALRWPMVRVLWLRKTRASMTESVLQTFEDYVLPAGLKRGPARDHRSSYDFPNGSKIVVGGLDNVDRIMSSEYDRISIFEATEVTEEEVQELMTRLSNTAMPFRQLVMDCNPGPPSHWLNQRAAPAANVDRSIYASVQAFNATEAPAGYIRRLLSRLEDNPVMFDHAKGEWQKMGLEYLDTIGALTGVRRKRKVEGVWAAADGLVYPDFENHIIPGFPTALPSPAIRVCGSIDWGWSDALAVLVGAECHDGHTRVVEEIFATKLAPDQMAVQLKALMAKWNIEAFYCDPSRPEIIKQMRRWGIPCVPHKVRMIDTGIALAETRLNAGYLDVYSCCTNLIREAGEYEYAKDRGGQAKTVPVGGNDHAMDSLRYLICGMDFGRTLPFSPEAQAMKEREADAPAEAEEMPEETARRLGHSPEEAAAEERKRAEEAEAERIRNLVHGDDAWQGM